MIILNIQYIKNSETTTEITSKLYCVDLAGSERLKRTNSTGIQLQEAKYINSSLSTLIKVISSLTDNVSTHIPYRDSKLTTYLQPSLSGNSNIYFLGTISPSILDLHESYSTLQFCSKCMNITVNPTRNINIDYITLCNKLNVYFYYHYIHFICVYRNK